MPRGSQQELAERVAALERENRRLRRWGSLAVLAAAAWAVSAWRAPAPQVVETTELRLVAEEGELLARLGTGDPDAGAATGDVALTFVDRNGQGALSLGVQDRFPGLRVVRDGRSLLRLGPEQIVLGSDGGSSDRRPGLRITPTRVEGYNRWSDGSRPDAHVSLEWPTDDLAHGPLLSMLHGDLGVISLGWGLQGEFELLLDDRRVFFGQDGELRWEDGPGP